jgi:ABC-type multidrug transport system ATPase subunit
MIVFRDVQARVRPVALGPLTATLEAGTHALVGGRLDGPSIVLALVAGHVNVRAGSVRVSGAAPDDSHVRRALAYVPLDAALPEPLRVDAALAMASRVRGERAKDPRSRLDVLGIASLATRAVRSLSREERRAVALAEALTCEAQVILVDEPLAALEPRAAAAACEALRARAAQGACVVVATASMREARTLADDVLTFARGALVRRAPASDPLVLAGPRGAAVRAVASDGARLAAALAEEAVVRDVSVVGGVVVARGSDAVVIAGAIARAAYRAEVTIESLVPDLLHDEELHAAATARPAAPTPAPAPEPPGTPATPAEATS